MQQLATAVDETEFGLGYQPIHYAAYNGHLRIVKHLVEDCGYEHIFLESNGVNH